MSGLTGTCSGSMLTDDPALLLAFLLITSAGPDSGGEILCTGGRRLNGRISRGGWSGWSTCWGSVTVSGSIISGDCRPAGRSLPEPRPHRRGSWVGDRAGLLSPLAARFPSLPLIAEDLGTITPDVRELMTTFGIPGMRVLQFGFDGDPENPHAPAAIGEDVVLYTGTHDNNTVRGWYEEEIGPEGRERIARVFGRLPSSLDIARDMITLALDSPARVVIIPVQDLLGLGSEARMNLPGRPQGTGSGGFVLVKRARMTGRGCGTGRSGPGGTGIWFPVKNGQGGSSPHPPPSWTNRGGYTRLNLAWKTPLCMRGVLMEG